MSAPRSPASRGEDWQAIAENFAADNGWLTQRAPARSPGFGGGSSARSLPDGQQAAVEPAGRRDEDLAAPA